MQESISDPLDLNKRQTHSGKYDAPPDGGTQDQKQNNNHLHTM